MQRKQCHICGEMKDIEEFYPSVRHRDGYRNDCKVCVNVRNREYFKNEYYPANKGKLISAVQERRQRGGKREGAGRPKTVDATERLNLLVDAQSKKTLDELAIRTKQSKSALIREAIGWLEKRYKETITI